MIPCTTPVITLTEREFLAICHELLGPKGIDHVNRAYVDRNGWDMTEYGMARMRGNLVERAFRELGPMSVGICLPDFKRIVLHFMSDADAVHFKLRFCEVIQ